MTVNKKKKSTRAQRAAKAASQEVEWLTPAPDGTAVELPWPDADGPFRLTCHLASVDGRTMLVGLDIRSFIIGRSGPEPGPHGLAEVNHPVLRSLRAGEIAEAARAKLAAELAAQSRSRKGTAADRELAARRFQTLTAPSAPNPSGQRPPSTHLETVADLYNQAVASGGDGARRPAIHVHRALLAQGAHDSLNAVRGQIHRARTKRLIPPAS